MQEQPHWCKALPSLLKLSVYLTVPAELKQSHPPMQTQLQQDKMLVKVWLFLLRTGHALQWHKAYLQSQRCHTGSYTQVTTPIYKMKTKQDCLLQCWISPYAIWNGVRNGDMHLILLPAWTDCFSLLVLQFSCISSSSRSGSNLALTWPQTGSQTTSLKETARKQCRSSGCLQNFKNILFHE